MVKSTQPKEQHPLRDALVHLDIPESIHRASLSDYEEYAELQKYCSEKWYYPDSNPNSKLGGIIGAVVCYKAPKGKVKKDVWSFIRGYDLLVKTLVEDGRAVGLFKSTDTMSYKKDDSFSLLSTGNRFISIPDFVPKYYQDFFLCKEEFSYCYHKFCTELESYLKSGKAVLLRCYCAPDELQFVYPTPLVDFIHSRCEIFEI